MGRETHITTAGARTLDSEVKSLMLYQLSYDGRRQPIMKSSKASILLPLNFWKMTNALFHKYIFIVYVVIRVPHACTVNNSNGTDVLRNT